MCNRHTAGKGHINKGKEADTWSLNTLFGHDQRREVPEPDVKNKFLILKIRVRYLPYGPLEAGFYWLEAPLR